ncbi:MAG: FHA domain-containing protein, partial [Blastocatellia bacterium]|nr:FHA domain-containing protein [Blastocatellia bacterium]
MAHLTLTIEGPYDTRSVDIDDEITIGRTSDADVVIDDEGLSRVNTTFFLDDGEVWVADENSTNGTFLNGERVVGRPRVVRASDVLKIGSVTTISVGSGSPVEASYQAAPPYSPDQPAPLPGVDTPAGIPQYQAPATKPTGAPILLMVSIGATLVILLFGGIALFVISQMADGPGSGGAGPKTASAIIPQRVIDPLGGENEEDLDDLIASWEVAEEELIASDVVDITGAVSENEEIDLNVSSAFLASRQQLAMAPRTGATGIRPAGLNVPKELFGDGVIKQTRKLREMREAGYRQPLDFGDLAEKRLSGELIELPVATESFYLDVGGSARDTPFMSFSFKEPVREIAPNHPKYDTLNRLASNFAGVKYDLNNAADRRQMRMRLLRMFHPRSRPILKELADAYFAQFQRPLRVTSLTRSMDYQILLNQGNPNSFVVRGEGALPPHTSGCAFDLARKHMSVDEQNFVMAKLAEMEREGRLDALIEYGVNACFHVFIYSDGQAPRLDL